MAPALCSVATRPHVMWFRSELIVILMSADPSPEEGITVHQATQRAIMVAYSG
jgi:hypothetical protein